MLTFENKKAYCKARLFTGHQILDSKSLLVDDGSIKGIVDSEEVPAHYERINLEGQLIVPAFIDLQIYGGNGKMFSHETTPETIAATYEYCKSGGASAFMITLATNSIAKFLEGFGAAKSYIAQGGKGLLGVHLEGPYINPVKRGAHILSYVKPPTLEEIELLLNKGKGVFKMMTLAPECCNPQLIKILQDEGILVSLGHSNASYNEATNAFNNGIPLATHLFNAMSSLQHRAPGVVGAIMNHPEVCSSVVCDGIHVDYAAVRIAKKILGNRLFHITDAVSHSEEGEYQHLFKGDHYALPDGTLSGSSLTMLQSVKNGIRHAGISLEESLRMASLYPARFLDGRKRGVLEAGALADLLVLDEDLNLTQMILSNPFL
jgi:N-acetylglucosamine-6-phosphate deacetylase